MSSSEYFVKLDDMMVNSSGTMTDQENKILYTYRVGSKYIDNVLTEVIEIIEPEDSSNTDRLNSNGRIFVSVKSKDRYIQGLLDREVKTHEFKAMNARRERPYPVKPLMPPPLPKKKEPVVTTTTSTKKPKEEKKKKTPPKTPSKAPKPKKQKLEILDPEMKEEDFEDIQEMHLSQMDPIIGVTKVPSNVPIKKLTMIVKSPAVNKPMKPMTPSQEKMLTDMEEEFYQKKKMIEESEFTTTSQLPKVPLTQMINEAYSKELKEVQEEDEDLSLSQALSSQKTTEWINRHKKLIYNLSQESQELITFTPPVVKSPDE